MLDDRCRRRKDLESIKRWEHKKPGHPLKDPLSRYKQPLSTKTRGRAIIEFDGVDIVGIRRQFGLTRRQFAHSIGVSVHTLRNWETGRRRPHGPARALLRALSADPTTLARTLLLERNRPVPADFEGW